MSHTRLLFHDAARDKVRAGATQLADAVRVTLGPKSRSVLIARKWGAPIVCNDGVTIAREIKLDDPEEDLGARLLRQAAERTGDEVGDGTSTATVLAQALFSEGLRNVVAGAAAVELKHGIERGAAVAVAALRALSRPVESRREKVQVAAVSAHNDTAIGELVADALERVGSEGAVSIEEAKGTETELEVVEGMRIDRGFLSPYFVTDPEAMEARLDEPLILLYEKRISNVAELLPLLEKVAQSGRPLAVVAEEVEAEALATLVVNKLRGMLRCVALKAPGFGERRSEMLDDIAILTGGRAIREELGVRLQDVELDQLGSASRVLVDKESTTFVGGAGDKAAIAGRVADLKKAREKADSDYEREKLDERIAKLAGGVAVLRVGAPSEAEMKSRKEAFEDALAATKAAIAEGVVPGGGVALVRAVDAVAEEEAKAKGDEAAGLRILRLSLEAPARQIAANSGADPGVVVEKLRAGAGGFGFDAAAGAYGDLVAAGIIDPTKVVRVALENAVSVAGVMLLADATMTEIEEPADKRAEPVEVG
jgi:chaperonin GroEL